MSLATVSPRRAKKRTPAWLRTSTAASVTLVLSPTGFGMRDPQSSPDAMCRVFSDPHRNPRRRGRHRDMGLIWEQLVVDAHDPVAQAAWWQAALGWVVVNDDPEEMEIRPSPESLPGLLFVRVPEGKTVKNRLHLDFRPDDRDAEVERLVSLGATRADVGQGDESWVVLDDPEGNEFCVLSSRPAAG